MRKEGKRRINGKKSKIQGTGKKGRKECWDADEGKGSMRKAGESAECRVKRSEEKGR